MKQDPKWRSLEENMQPGAVSAEGFLGDDPHTLSEIIQSDQLAVDRLGLTHEGIARRMAALTESGKQGLGRPVVLEDCLEVVVEDYMGMIACPFRDSMVEKRLTTCRNTCNGREIRWSDLNIHLILLHGFYEGQGSPFRVDPDELAAVLFQR